MYDAQTLRAAFAGLVGFFQPYDPSYPDINPALTNSASGRVVQQAHPLCAIETLVNVAPEFKKFVYPAWVAATAYGVSSTVSHGGKVWRTLVELASGYPAPGSGGAEEWVEQDKFSIWLGDTYNHAVTKMVADLIRYKKLEGHNRTLIDSLMLFDGIGTLQDRIIKSGRFVALELKISRQDGLQVAVNKMGLQLDTAQGVVPIYLYHSSVQDALEVFNLNITNPYTFNWTAVQDIVLKFYDDNYDTDGVFYLGYYEEDLIDGAQAVMRRSNWGTSPCTGCNEYNLMAYRKYSKHMDIQAVAFTPAEGRLLPDQARVVYHNDTNWGMNLHVTVACDLTQFFIMNKGMMADALCGAIVVKLLEQVAYSTRMTAVADKTRMLALADIDATDKRSFAARYHKEIEALSVDFSGISSDCLPCTHKKGITFGAV